MTDNNRVIWIDLENTPHVPFFKPVVEELNKRGYPVKITARDCFQVCSLADYHKLPYERIGHHYGKNKIMKIVGLLFRAAQMLDMVKKWKPVLAVSHSSRSQMILSNMLHIPSVAITDYEHSKTLFFTVPKWVIAPKIIPDSAITMSSKNILRYSGIKEDVYVPTFTPEPGILSKLGINDDEVVVTVRPPATEAHYHNPESDQLFQAAVRRIAAHSSSRIVFLPRNKLQGDALRKMWTELLDKGKAVIPAQVVDGLNLIWHSDLVISGGGTMNREAAALGVPVYSVFRGKIGAVDKYLSDNGRLILLENTEDVDTKIILEKWKRPAKPDFARRPALQEIVDNLVAILEGC